jgi:hypothetical protein
LKFRKKPVVIEAVQLLEGQLTPEGVNFSVPLNPGEGDFREGKYWIHTLEGDHIANIGDWIITGVKGERYPCKPDIFEATYDAVE